MAGNWLKRFKEVRIAASVAEAGERLRARMREDPPPNPYESERHARAVEWLKSRKIHEVKPLRRKPRQTP